MNSFNIFDHLRILVLINRSWCTYVESAALISSLLMNPPALPQSPSTMVTLACWVYGTNDSFAVTASPVQTVSLLKKAIMDEDPIRFPGIHAGQLELCVADIPGTRAATGMFVFQEEGILQGFEQIRNCFPDGYRFPEKTIHLCIRNPSK